MMTVRDRRPRGFTLIELLVVIGIIVILIGLLIPGIARVRRAAYGAATQSQLTTLANAITQYYGDFHAYPGPLPNSQIGQAFNGGTPAYVQPFVTDSSGNPLQMQFPAAAQAKYITGAENLVLGLLGGLEIQTSGNTVTFGYNAADLFTLDSSNVPTGVAPKGALSLNYSRPKRFPAYLQVNRGDLSEPNPTMNNGAYIDEAGRLANDTVIPEFVDKFSTPMPILYFRTNVGGTAIAGIGGKGDDGAALVDSSGAAITPQYDLAQILGYTRPTGMNGGINTKLGNASADHHGLQGLGTGGNGASTVPLTDTIPSGWSNTINPGYNGLAYLKDPTANSTTAINSTGSARQKDGYLLISAGPDGIYGTSDDLIYPGTLNP